MTELCNQVVREGAIPREWELSTLIPIFKGKGKSNGVWFIQSSEAVGTWMKVLEGVLEKRLRWKVKIDDMQFGFAPGKGTVDAIFMVRQLQEKLHLWTWRRHLIEYQERLLDGH